MTALQCPILSGRTMAQISAALRARVRKSTMKKTERAKRMDPVTHSGSIGLPIPFRVLMLDPLVERNYEYLSKILDVNARGYFIRVNKK